MDDLWVSLVVATWRSMAWKDLMDQVDYIGERCFNRECSPNQHLLVLMCNLYYGQKATVRTEHGETERLSIGKGAEQGCILSPYLFNLYAEHICTAILDSDEGVKISGRNIT